MKDAKDYSCSECGAIGCKLWRQYQTFLCNINLFCVDCAGTNQKEDVTGVDNEGRRQDRIGPGGLTTSIGWLIPAIPTEEGDTFWGYSSVPEPLVEWWRTLPTRTTSVKP